MPGFDDNLFDQSLFGRDVYVDASGSVAGRGSLEGTPEVLYLPSRAAGELDTGLFDQDLLGGDVFTNAFGWAGGKESAAPYRERFRGFF